MESVFSVMKKKYIYLDNLEIFHCNFYDSWIYYLKWLILLENSLLMDVCVCDALIKILLSLFKNLFLK